jgi:oxygen-independent coproporphyrinogen III oxidase
MHVYIHVPFCARRCTYCDFAIAVRRTVPSAAFVSAVLREWALWQDEPAWESSPAVETIYLGGGTPSRLDPEAVAHLLGALRRDRPVAPDAEITLEANPDDVGPASAKAWMAAGINRISLGVQSFEDSVLRWMHRTHSASQVGAAVDALRQAGFDDLSLDLIFGLPAQLQRDWAADLEHALALEPEHLSLYGLSFEPATPLGHRARRGEVIPVPDERYAAEFLAAHETLVDRGYEHYEVSNAARPGHRARHNAAYWQRRPYIGLGPSAHSGLGRERRWNIREWVGYERALLEQCSPMAGKEVLEDSAAALEQLYLGLRTDSGLDSTRVPAQKLQQWQQAGWADCHSGTVRLTPEGWLRLDALTASASA